MDNNHFDHKIKQALESLEPQYDKHSWEVLADRIDSEVSATDTESDEMDHIVRQKLDSIHPVYDPLSWPLLLEKLEAFEAFRKRLYITKLIEGALVVLVLITLLPYLSINSEIPAEQESLQLIASSAINPVISSK